MNSNFCKALMIVFLLLTDTVKADSPLTSTPFYTAYLDIAQVKAHEDAASISPEGLKFLDSNAPSDQKAALINALGWGKEGLIKEYRSYLAAKHQLKESFFDSILIFRGDQPLDYPGTDKLSQDELMCLGYIQAMGDYFNPLKGHYCVYQSFAKGPKRTHALIYGLVVAQYNLDINWCYVYQVMEYCRDQQGIEKDQFRDEALKIIFEYIDLYQGECGDDLVEDDPYGYGLVQPKPEYYPFEGVQANNGKKDHSDLMIEEIIRPEYLEAYQGTLIKVIIKNTGPSSTFPSLAKLSEIDLSLAEAKRLGLKGQALQYAGELDLRGDDPTGDDPYFETWAIIPVIEGGKRYVLEFIIPGHWVYDPNCEFKVELDTENNITEPNEKNNVMYFVEGG